MINSEEKKKTDIQNSEVAIDLLKTAIHTEEWGKRGNMDTIMFYAFKGENPDIKSEAIGYFAYMIDNFETHNIDEGDIAIIKNEIPNWLKDNSQKIRKSAQAVANAIKARILSRSLI